MRVVERNFSFDEGRCMFALDENSQKLIHELKYHGARDVIRDFPAWIERALVSVFFGGFGLDPRTSPFEKIEVKRLQPKSGSLKPC